MGPQFPRASRRLLFAWRERTVTLASICPCGRLFTPMFPSRLKPFVRGDLGVGPGPILGDA